MRKEDTQTNRKTDKQTRIQTLTYRQTNGHTDSNRQTDTNIQEQ